MEYKPVDLECIDGLKKHIRRELNYQESKNQEVFLQFGGKSLQGDWSKFTFNPYKNK